ncbi:haloacid dehalogenase-like hydrolase domain-containing protein 2 [Pseudozyma hubeiensis SY62]|uniref:Haloacid dehalogenase-like hydrolase domain-containing protein 2 n=1 Tax=Pseudozyma hubeiensis (strain SY62) TaxID=1305764 RepID=R9PBU2_PSEHS|nr:haloacid dehalogenase-like hydrolase domain-containing protein 2 [Pseudozyma hubeiensis SY62]GAC98821.1 haloacid dehalogenase-like hydrolase domain-containing protein 2 [Pseudozyma hubeiensis SY62]
MTKLVRSLRHLPTSASAQHCIRSMVNQMDSTRYNVLIDLNGTCHISDEPTPGAVEAMQKLRAAQHKFPDRLNLRFCSNTSKESSHSLLSRLRRVGFGADLVTAHDVFTSLDAAIRLVSRRNLRPLLLLSSSAQASFMEAEPLAKACFFASPELDPARMSAEQRFRLRACNAVVVGLCPELMTQKWLDEAFRLLSGEYGATQQVALIATHRALYHRPSEGAPLSMGPGAFVAALEAACHRDASSTTICGKPSEAFLRECIAGMMSRAEERMDSYTNIIFVLASSERATTRAEIGQRMRRTTTLRRGSIASSRASSDDERSSEDGLQCMCAFDASEGSTPDFKKICGDIRCIKRVECPLAERKEASKRPDVSEEDPEFYSGQQY